MSGVDLIKLQINAGRANATGPSKPVSNNEEDDFTMSTVVIGPILGQKGVNAVDFCKQFNELTAEIHPTFEMVTKVYAVKRKFTLSVSYPSIMFFLKKAARLKKSSGSLSNMAPLSIRWIYEIALLRKQDPRWESVPLISLCKVYLGTTRSLHLELVE